MLAYKDFGTPKPVTTGTFIKIATMTSEPFDTALLQANAWIEEESIAVTSVETVQLGENPPFLRVWYASNAQPTTDRMDR